MSVSPTVFDVCHLPAGRAYMSSGFCYDGMRNGIDRGELLREGHDETMTIDPHNLRLLDLHQALARRRPTSNV